MKKPSPNTVTTKTEQNVKIIKKLKSYSSINWLQKMWDQKVQQLLLCTKKH